jgi:hypothetical protein
MGCAGTDAQLHWPRANVAGRL